MPDYRPQRVVCLTAETAELAFALGGGERVVGVSGYAVRPPEARKKPRVSAFSTAHVGRIVALEPDLVLGFSDLQAEIARDLVRAGIAVLVTNQRTLEETYRAMTVVAGALGEQARGERLVGTMKSEMDAIAGRAGGHGRRPRVYFEEWDDPMISGIGWVSELIELCGGEDVFAGLRGGQSASERFVTSEQVIAAQPEVIVASWCGKKARPEKIAARPGWGEIPAVREGRIYEIKAPDILQPGLSLVHGARELARMLRVGAFAGRG